MSTNSQDQEIDLGQVFKKIGNLFQSIIDLFFDFILFIKRNIIIIIILFVLGFIIGFFLDKKDNEYDHQIIVSPNFGSVDYLYSKIKLLNSRNDESDTVFLKKIGIINTKKIGEIEIEPIVDVYKFIENKEQNFDLIKLMAENGDINKIVKDELTSKNYPFHVIKFTTKDKTIAENTVKPILNFLNESDYFNSVKNQYTENLKIKIQANEATILQIDNLLNEFAKTSSSNQKSDKLVYYNENSELNEIIKTKDLLVIEQGKNRINLINIEKTIKEIATTINIKNKKGLNGKLKLLLPILFLILFSLIVYFHRFYKKQIKRRKIE